MYWAYLKALVFLYAFEESVDCHLLSSFCDDSNLHISLFKYVLSTIGTFHDWISFFLWKFFGKNFLSLEILSFLWKLNFFGKYFPRCTFHDWMTTKGAQFIRNSETKRPMQVTIYTWITNYQKQNAYVSVLVLYVGMLFLFWIYGCWRSSAKWASHLNLDEWTVNIAMLNRFAIVNA